MWSSSHFFWTYSSMFANKNLTVYLWLSLLLWLLFSTYNVSPSFLCTQGLGLFSFLASMSLRDSWSVIIIFQLISLSTSWVGWLDLFGIIITCQPNILGYWWIWWSTIIWHCYSSLHISFNKMNSPVDFSLSELEWWAGYLSTYQFWQEVFKMPLWADRWSCTSFSVW